MARIVSILLYCLLGGLLAVTGVGIFDNLIGFFGILAVVACIDLAGRWTAFDLFDR